MFLNVLQTHPLSPQTLLFSLFVSESPLLRIRSIYLSLFLYKQTLSSFHKPYPFFLSLQSLSHSHSSLNDFKSLIPLPISDLNLHMAMSDGTKMNLPDDLFSSKLTDSSHSSLKGNSIRFVRSILIPFSIKFVIQFIFLGFRNCFAIVTYLLCMDLF